MSSDNANLNIAPLDLRARDLELYIQEIEDELPGTLDAGQMIDVMSEMTTAELEEVHDALKESDEMEIGRIYITALLRQYRPLIEKQARQAQADDLARDDALRSGERA